MLSLQAQQQQQPLTRVLLTHLELEGFKSFRDRAVLGPLSDFSCVVGPNGCGKSVVGEAIAFVLGGNRKMLRTGSLAGLLNQELAAAGHRTAEVVLHMELLLGQHQPQPNSPQSASAAAAGHPDGQPTSTAQADTPVRDSLPSASDPAAAVTPLPTNGTQQQQQQHTTDAQPRQQLKLKRVLRGDASKSYIMRPGSSSWSAVSQAQLQMELAPYGTDTQVVDRYIVTQSRQAVDVSDPVGLVQQLEALTTAGAIDYDEAIAQHSTRLEQMAAGMEGSKADIDRLLDERELLAPAVEHWQQVQALKADVRSTKLQLLTEQQEHGRSMLARQSQQVEAAEEAAAAATDALSAAQARETDLQQQRSALDKELLLIKEREEALQKKAAKLSAAAAATEVQHSAASTALQDNRSLLKALQKKLAQHDRQEAQHKQRVEEGTEPLRQLQEAAAAAQEHLASARRAAGLGKTGQRAKGAAQEAQQPQPVDPEQQRLQRQLADLRCEVQLLAARQAAAAIKATRAARSVEALERKADAAAAATAERQEQVQAAEQEVEAAAAAVAAHKEKSAVAEQQWRSADVQQLLLMEQLDDAQQQEQPHNQPQQQPGSHGATTTPGASPSYDAAVQHLSTASTAGQLPGHFHGRLCNLAAVSDPSLELAANAALQERCNMGTTLVVSDRPTAAAVIEHFRQHRVGTVNCRILSELPQQQQQQQRQPQQGKSNTNINSNRSSAPLAGTVAGGGGGGSTSVSVPLLDCLLFDGQGVPGLQGLMDQLLGGWLLVETRDVALQLLHLRRNVVTRSGEVFKADGEIVANLGGASSSNRSSSNNGALPAYSLAVGQPVPLPTTNANKSNDPSNTNTAADKTAASAAAAAQAKKLKQQLAAAQQAARAAEKKLQEARMSLLQQEQQLAAAQTRLGRLQQQQQQAGWGRAHGSNADGMKQQELQAARTQQQEADGELAAANAAVAAAEKQQKELLQQLAAAEASAQGGGNSSGDASQKTTAAAAALQRAEQEAAAASAAVESAWQEVEKAKQQQKRAASRAAAISKEVNKAEAAAAATDADRLQAKLDSLRQQLSEAQSEVQQARTEAASTASKLKPLRQQLMKAVAAKDKAVAAVSRAQAELQQAQAVLTELQQQQQQRAQALQQLQETMQQAQPTSTDPTPAAGAADAAAAALTVDEDSARGSNSKRAKTVAAGGSGGELFGPEPDVASGALMSAGELSGGDAAATAAGAAAAVAGDTQMEMEIDGGGESGLVVSSKQRRQATRRPAQTNGSRKTERGSRQRNTRARARVILDSSSSSGSSSASEADDECSSSSGDDDAVPASAAAGTRRASRCARSSAAAAAAAAAVGGGGGGSNAKQRAPPTAAALSKQAAQLQARQQQLDDEEAELQQQYALVDKSALQRDLTALQSLAEAHSTLQQLQQQHEAAAAALDQLLDERYSRLLSVLQRLNAALDAVYNRLSGGVGKAYCSYTPERRLLFTQGVTLHVQPDGSTWRRLGMLSGGQRALATLALSFALQTLFPSPFYFFDEVDCALDTSAAARVAAYVRQQCSGAAAAQYLLVSHKPVVFESAGCLLGVYSNGRGSSAAVVGHFG